MTRTRLLSVALLAGLACGQPPPGPTPSPVAPSAEALPDFALLDVNPASTTSGQAIGPTRYRGKVSGWYFTHTT